MTEAIACSRCLYTTSHPLGLIVDDEGVCSGCRIHEEKDRLDFAERWEKLVSIIAPYRATSGKTYDCIVPVTGAHDSHWIVHVVKERLGLNPLLVTYNKYFNTPLGIRNLANLRIKFDCDVLIQNVNPLSVKKITRTTLREFGSIYWPCLAGQTVFPVQTAVRYKVPLIIWGAHQGLEQVGMFSHEHEVEMTRRYRKDHDLMGREADDLLSIFDTLKEEDIWQYRYPSDGELNSVGIRGIYLGNYIRWDPKAQHERMAETHGYKGAAFRRTFDTYDYVDCFNYMDVHDHLKWIKHGYSKVTDHACREIRHGRLDRETALALVRHYEEQPLQYLDRFLEWLDLTPAGLEFVLNEHRNRDMFDEMKPNRWHRKPRPDAAPADIRAAERRLAFVAEASLDSSGRGAYVTVGKGFPL
ncbi:N-acetyl sugar amidotransferase [Sphingomonas sp. MAH-20]|jgi:N-acetyl sugar amidotransferase|uniref:N-acetyl sugar amidotransferase n=1 Tax=Sphingomonas horti TaxID=2682842 RepID=A0A6I4J134_9SPHN|nr:MULTISPECIES: N-acetyl sugar amidotransferase [Sphingomonas]MBA2919763.1 N-acetyl sugar amidotransferase [Sphingomonas sp. CGMCC 1.13658]MVO78004.1 N-acetyl sugar amidotransferase [Sphingomonas horti]